MVAALILSLKGPANKSAAFKNIAARSSQGKFAQFSFAANAAFIACSTCYDSPTLK
jgi:hypothetical protein